ncbi:Fe2+-enterobactin ABC transporter substrate-binding protein [Kineococcus arenarius]|uniref:Fe2+-enterobactin ABC transporter substrate-binding protein n=1 Tax=unclassified Kineococcus TaxID=2621656 RepID=UPI003D7C7319
MRPTAPSRRTLLSALAAAVPLAAVSACSSGTAPDAAAASPEPSATGGAGSTGSWPRTVVHEGGETVLAAAPQRVVSASVTLTGALLAVGAPVVGTGTTAASALTDEHGFFSQWAPVAVERGVQPLYALEPNLEVVAAAAPDLVVGSASGADSVSDAYEQLSALAPTVLLRYDDVSWQEVTRQVARATGFEEEAERVVSEHARLVEQARAAIVAPGGPVAALVFNGTDDARVWTAASAQGELLTDLGFELVAVPEGSGQVVGGRSDVVQVSAENLPAVLAPAAAVVLFSAAQEQEAAFAAVPTLAQLPAVSAGRVVAAGADSFRLDAYSAANVVRRLQQRFA